MSQGNVKVGSKLLSEPQAVEALDFWDFIAH